MYAGVAESADAADLKSAGIKSVWVQIPPPALWKQKQKKKLLFKQLLFNLNQNQL